MQCAQALGLKEDPHYCFFRNKPRVFHPHALPRQETLTVCPSCPTRPSRNPPIAGPDTNSTRFECFCNRQISIFVSTSTEPGACHGTSTANSPTAYERGRSSRRHQRRPARTHGRRLRCGNEVRLHQTLARSGGRKGPRVRARCRPSSLTSPSRSMRSLRSAGTPWWRRDRSDKVTAASLPEVVIVPLSEQVRAKYSDTQHGGDGDEEPPPRQLGEELDQVNLGSRNQHYHLGWLRPS